MDLLEKYQREYETFVSDIDDINIEEKLKKVPVQKHYFVARLIDAKITKNNLEKKLSNLRKKEIGKIVNEGSPANLNNKTISSMADNSEDIIKVKDDIKELEFIIEYLELAVKQITFIGNDFKNIIEYKKLQEL